MGVNQARALLAALLVPLLAAATERVPALRGVWRCADASREAHSAVARRHARRAATAARSASVAEPGDLSCIHRTVLRVCCFAELC